MQVAGNISIYYSNVSNSAIYYSNASNSSVYYSNAAILQFIIQMQQFFSLLFKCSNSSVYYEIHFPHMPSKK